MAVHLCGGVKREIKRTELGLGMRRKESGIDYKPPSENTVTRLRDEKKYFFLSCVLAEVQPFQYVVKTEKCAFYNKLKSAP